MEEKEYILNEIRKSGLPTEYFTRELLKKYAFTTTSQVPYIDQETGKYRALDILAEIHDSRAKTSIILYIECKKSEKQLVFFLGDRREGEYRAILMDEDGSSVFSYMTSIEINEGKGISYHIVGSSKDFLFEAQMQILKAINYHEKFIEKKSFFVIPIIVFDGKIFEYDGENDGLKDLKWVNYVSNGIPADPTPCMIDVVSKEYLELYLRRVISRSKLPM